MKLVKFFKNKNSKNNKKITVCISGFTNIEKIKPNEEKIEMWVTTEVESTRAGDSWIPWDKQKIDFELNTNEYGAIWKKGITLPFERNKCRLRIEEFETFCEEVGVDNKCKEGKERHKLISSFIIKLQ